MHPISVGVGALGGSHRAPPTPSQSQHHCLGHLGKGNEAPGELLGQGPLLLPASSPLHFNTLLHCQLVCTAQNVPSIISVCTFATVCAGCTLKAIKSSFVCPQGSHGVFPPQHARARPKTRHQPPLEGLGLTGKVFLGEKGLGVHKHMGCTLCTPPRLCLPSFELHGEHPPPSILPLSPQRSQGICPGVTLGCLCPHFSV